ncbi:MAG TPA: L-threonylcarbamoyladenylate synthase [Clostridiaceae bacterium]
MDTIIRLLKDENPDIKIIMEAASIIKRGGIVAFPTETVYGLGANALDEKAVFKIFEAKGRPQDNPLIIHIASYNIEEYAYEIPEYAYTLMKKFWPGPFTMIFKKKNIIPNMTSGGLETIGIRMPSNLIARELIKYSGVPIAAPSANISGRPSPTNVNICIEDLKGKVDMIIGGGSSEVGIESTILDCSVNPPCILRPGGITLEMLKEYLEDVYMDPSVLNMEDKTMRPKAPGMRYRHYAPKAQVKIVTGDLEKTVAKINEIVQNYRSEKFYSKKIGILATDETFNSYPHGIVKSIGSRKDISTIAHNIFETLRWMDGKGVEIILSESFEEKGIGLAVMNRLKKSSGYNIIKV